jgi:photosystem II stability/assembly factor-like uncharacterized protein
LWKTTDNGASWACVFAGRPYPSIGAVAIAPSNPEVVWIGTGEANPRNSVSWGNGCFRSTDGGATWMHCGLAATHHVGRIVVHPHDPNTAWVAALGRLWGSNRERGVFRTSDGGKTWQHVLALDDQTGCVDLAIDPGNPGTLFAAAYRVRRGAFMGGDPATQFGPKAGLYRSRDGGRTWTRLRRGLPTRPLGRCGLAVSRRNSRLLYAVVQTDRTEISRTPGQPPRTGGAVETGGIFRSRDGGDTWEKLNDLCPRPFYFGQVRIDPTDDSRLYVLGVRLFASRDGGRSFNASAAKAIHADHHDLWIDPADPGRLVLATDGGVYYSASRGVRWEHCLGLPIGQFYTVTLDGSRPYRIYGGLQDNGTWGGPSRTRNPAGITVLDWKRVLGMDGFHCRLDPRDPHCLYAEGQYGRLFRIDLRTGERVAIRPAPAQGTPYRFHWSAPLLLSPHDGALYHGGNAVFRSRDRGQTWKVVSPDLTHGEPGATYTSTGHALTSLAQSPVRGDVLWSGSDDGRVCLTRDGGTTWADVGHHLPGVPLPRAVTRVECSHFRPGCAWVSLSRHRQDDRAPYLFATEDFGATWKSLAAGLPREGPVHVVRADPRHRSLIYAGTELGLFASLDAGRTWQPLGTGLPPVPVQDLAVHPRDRELVVATHGRGLWVIDVAPLQQLTAKVLATPVHLFSVRPAEGGGPREPARQPPRSYAAPNPPSGTSIYYLLRDRPAGPVELSVCDAAGRVVARLPAPAAPGLHRIDWDSSRRLADGGSERVSRGEYTVRLQVGGQVLTRRLEVRPAE